MLLPRVTSADADATLLLAIADADVALTDVRRRQRSGAKTKNETRWNNKIGHT